MRIIELQKVCAFGVDIDYNPNPDLTLVGKSTSPDKAHEIYDRTITVKFVVYLWSV